MLFHTNLLYIFLSKNKHTNILLWLSLICIPLSFCPRGTSVVAPHQVETSSGHKYQLNVLGSPCQMCRLLFPVATLKYIVDGARGEIQAISDEKLTDDNDSVDSRSLTQRLYQKFVHLNYIHSSHLHIYSHDDRRWPESLYKRGMPSKPLQYLYTPPPPPSTSPIPSPTQFTVSNDSNLFVNMKLQRSYR